MVQYDIVKMKALANHMRDRGVAIEGKVPLGWPSRENAVNDMEACQVAKRLDETLCNLDSVLKYHAGRMRKMAEATDAGVVIAEAMDVTNAGEIEQAGPR
ncbi:hypothetical protein AB0L82_07790 [Nocardia sp. NPDC052001]|uniref:hypothetical protein n=1 Tax=Nocardia sp. NPDC052001 TaxID=3154853 RepID=UPI00344593A8